MENVKPVRQHPDSHISASSSSDSSPELSSHPKESLEQDASLSPIPAAASSFPDVSSQAAQWSMINHPPGYDPNRIPKSIFSSKPTTTEWSTSSNESLFSIQMGANSFSTDYSYLVAKSGKLPEEWKNSPANPYYAYEVKSNDSKNLSSPLPPLIEVSRDNDGKNASALEGPGIQVKNVETPKVMSEEKPVNDIKQKTTNAVEKPAATTSNRPDDRFVPPTTEATRISSPAHASSPCHSEASGNSSSSFAFPV
ncbi:hypothetical protein K7X08_035768 [Anisodus acutangulus]|uniref:Uncharacterized protein n=1 Tax=Anisodus acutangulus TaxID=402998 RepID=A0A9Q1L5X7_9SOLA|nr:hypothetical protein K7X08_035768 [Anisodus acutangulus]